MCNGQNNVMCPGQINPVAQNILNLYPLPNANGWAPGQATGGLTTNNYKLNTPTTNNTVQWDPRIHWNISNSDQAYASYSYDHVINFAAPPLGPILDGSGYGGDYEVDLAQNFMLSETHFFWLQL